MKQPRQNADAPEPRLGDGVDLPMPMHYGVHYGDTVRMVPLNAKGEVTYAMYIGEDHEELRQALGTQPPCPKGWVWIVVPTGDPSVVTYCRVPEMLLSKT